MSPTDDSRFLGRFIHDIAHPEDENRARDATSRRAIDSSLLDAAASAAGEEGVLDEAARASQATAVAAATELDRRQTSADVTTPSPTSRQGKRKRAAGATREAEGELQFKNYSPPGGDPGARKRSRTEYHAPGHLNESVDATMDSPDVAAEESRVDDSSFMVNEYPPAVTMSDARAAGVYSAAALFRKPTSSSKKYTRPPMSKVFGNLELTPETFLRLQAAAKAYMLDQNFPERQNCVGNRSKGDGNITKLNLYSCVKDFLGKEGHGEFFFGQNSDGASRRSFMWPRDMNKIISLCTPLLRRMVTNERQRQYAVETRKGNASAGKAGSNTSTRLPEGSNTSTLTLNAPEMPTQSHSMPPPNQFDPLLATYGPMPTTNEAAAVTRQVQSFFNMEDQGLMMSVVVVPASTVTTLEEAPSAIDQSRHRIISHFEFPAIGTPNFGELTLLADRAAHKARMLHESLNDPLAWLSVDGGIDTTGEASSIASPMDPTYPHQRRSRRRRAPMIKAHSISAHGPAGLQQITDDATWRRVVDAAERTVWMEQRLKVVIEVELPLHI